MFSSNVAQLKRQSILSFNHSKRELYLELCVLFDFAACRKYKSVLSTPLLFFAYFAMGRFVNKEANISLQEPAVLFQGIFHLTAPLIYVNYTYILHLCVGML